MGFNSGFKGLNKTEMHKIKLVTFSLVAYRRRSSARILEPRIAC